MLFEVLTMATEVIMPSLGESVFEGMIAAWLKSEGDAIEQFEPILEIETDKVTTEATAEVAGTLLKILVQVGETVPVGTVLAYIGEPGESVSEFAESKPKSTEDKIQEQIKRESAVHEATAPNLTPNLPSNGPSQQPSRRYTGRISPVVGRIAEEHGVDLNLISGTGKNGRITKKDILSFIDQKEQGQILQAPPPVTIATPLEDAKPPALEVASGEVVELSNIRRAIAEHMVRSKQTSPHVTTVFDVDFSTVTAHRSENKAQFSRDGANLTFTAYIIAAIVKALRAHPLVNSTWTDAGILLKKEINIGMATAISEGLIVPVIKNADTLSLLGLARSINDLSNRARLNQLQPDEVQGGTFTLTNHGVSGSLFATPIINQPQCGILGVGKIEKRVKVIGDAIAIRPMAYASLTFDHRILDGATADYFMSAFKETLENWS
jgi:2-oxoglutarate dehydrogenase E2 component (dihydrolipoamide succinyltransferase)